MMYAAISNLVTYLALPPSKSMVNNTYYNQF